MDYILNYMKHAYISVKDRKKTLTLTHPRMRVIFDKKTGKLNVFDKRTGDTLLRDAGFRLDCRGNKPWPNAPTRYRHTVRKHSRTSCTTLTVTVTATPLSKHKPVVQIHYVLRPDSNAIEIGWSVINRLSHEVRVQDVEPIYAGALCPKQALKMQKHLSGGAGAAPNIITTGWKIETHNSLMATGASDNGRFTVVAGGLRYNEFARTVEISCNRKRLLTLAVWDPQGKRIPSGSVYRSEDSCYLDLLTSDPFEALEQYGLSLRAANHARPHSYNFPTLCGWMVSTKHLGEGKPINNSAGLVKEMDMARKKGLMKYTPLAPRLEPDYYCYRNDGDTQQGWWDDEHFARYGSLTKPYDTFAKFCRAVADRDGIPFTYMQVSLPSNDFAVAHPDWMLNNDISQLHRTHAHHRPFVRYDYTDPGFQAHMRRVWKRFHNAGLKGIKFDYPETGWNAQGGFENHSYTTTSAYRTIYELAKDGLGKDSYVHERILGGKTHESAPCLDVTAGIVDLQRVWGDASHFEPEMASRIGLRWYKSRSVFHYYPDGKSFFHNGRPLPSHHRRAFLTLIGFLGGRLEIGTSIGSMSKEMIHDLTRLYPIFEGIRSPRPVDMLSGKKHPEVYSYRVTDEWHQVLLVNNTKRRKTVSTPISGSHVEGAGLQLDASQRYHAFDFWNQQYLGCLSGQQVLQASLRPGEVAMISLRRKLDRPQVISTNRHIMQGMVECHNVEWNTRKGLTGYVDVIGGEPFVLTVACNGKCLSQVTANKGLCSIAGREKGLLDIIFSCENNQRLRFSARL